MSRFEVAKPEYFMREDLYGVSAAMRMAGKEIELVYKSNVGPLSTGLEPFLAAALVPAMKANAQLDLPGPVSARLLHATDQIQEIFHTWDTDLRPIQINAGVAPQEEHGTHRGVACFFSGGVDAFYTILKHRTEIDALVHVHGFAIRLAERDVQADILPTLREAAAQLGKPLIEIETNIYDATEGLAEWVWEWGAALASVALLLAPLFRKVYLPASYTYGQLIPDGSHPVLDPLWSSEAVEIVHDGCEARRLDKVNLLATSETALNHLRVCFTYREAYNKGLYNCGHCEKCLRTQISLYLAGALERCATLPHTLDFDAISHMPGMAGHGRVFATENLELARRLHSDPELIRALQDALDSDGPGAQHAQDAIRSQEVAQRLEQEASELRMAVRALQETVQALHASRSWRLTGPLRALGDTLRQLHLIKE